MRKSLVILLFLCFHFSHVLPMEKPQAAGSGHNFARLKKVNSCPEPPRQKDDFEKLRPGRHSSGPFVFPVEGEKDRVKDLRVDVYPEDLGLNEEIEERDRILNFHKNYQNWEHLLPEQQKILLFMLPAYYEYRGLYSSYFYGNKKNLKPDYENACVKIQKLMDDFNKTQLPAKLEKIKSFSVVSYSLSSYMVINGQYPVRLFDRNLFGKEYRRRLDLFLTDPFNEKAYLDVVMMQEEISRLANKENLLSR